MNNYSSIVRNGGSVSRGNCEKNDCFQVGSLPVANIGPLKENGDMSTSEFSESLFHGESGTARADIIRWWEGRRLRFNFWVGLVGIITWLLVMFAGGAAVKPGEDFEEPLVMIFGPMLYAILANLWYTLGWITDVIAYRGSPRQGMFKAGFIFSIVLTALPGIWAVVALLITIYTGHKLD